jgi:hypothetical protein
MPDKVMTSTTAEPCACCASEAFIVSSLGGTSGENISNFNAGNSPPANFTELQAESYLSSSFVFDCWAALFSSGVSYDYSAVSGSIAGQDYQLSISSINTFYPYPDIRCAVKVYIYAATGLSITLDMLITGSPLFTGGEVIVSKSDRTTEWSQNQLSAGTSATKTYNITVASDGYYIVNVRVYGITNGVVSWSQIDMDMSFTLDMGADHVDVEAQWYDPDSETFYTVTCPPA